MAYGLETFNSSEDNTLAVSDRVPRFVTSGSTTVSFAANASSATSSNVTVANMANDDGWLVLESTLDPYIYTEPEKYSGYFKIKAQ